MKNELNELVLCLTRALAIINDLADKTELTKAQKNDFVRMTELIMDYETLSADEKINN